MRDVVMVAVTTAFFALCLAYVRWCDHIIGPDPIDRPDDDLADRSTRRRRRSTLEEVPA